MNEDNFSSQEEEVEERALTDDAGVDDYLGPDILSEVTQLYFNDIGQNQLLTVEEEVRHARRVRQIQIEALASLRKILHRSGISRETLL